MKAQTLVVPAVRTRVADFVALTKPRLNLLVIATAGAGYYLGAGDRVDYAILFHTLAGTALVACGAAALNQILERDLDAMMRRTRWRPLPEGRLQVREASWFAGVLVVLGLLALGLGANLLAATVAAVTLTTYAAIYTPLKRRTAFATVVGAVPGALPPMIGWAAATSTISREAWILFGIVFLWQMPHFLAIAWLYRDDFKRAGIPLLPVLDPDGRSTGLQVTTYAAALLPVSLTPTLVGLSGGVYFAGALVCGILFVALSLRFARRRTTTDARWLFLGSLGYLPILWGLMIADRL